MKQGKHQQLSHATQIPMLALYPSYKTDCGWWGVLFHGSEADIQFPISNQGGLFIFDVEVPTLLRNGVWTKVKASITICIWSRHEECIIKILTSTYSCPNLELLLMWLLIDRLGSIFDICAILRWEESVNTRTEIGQANPLDLSLNGISAHRRYNRVDICPLNLVPTWVDDITAIPVGVELPLYARVISSLFVASPWMISTPSCSNHLIKSTLVWTVFGEVKMAILSKFFLF